LPSSHPYEGVTAGEPQAAGTSGATSARGRAGTGDVPTCGCGAMAALGARLRRSLSLPPPPRFIGGSGSAGSRSPWHALVRTPAPKAGRAAEGRADHPWDPPDAAGPDPPGHRALRPDWHPAPGTRLLAVPALTRRSVEPIGSLATFTCRGRLRRVLHPSGFTSLPAY
jgi:hypothetical protein